MIDNVYLLMLDSCLLYYWVCIELRLLFGLFFDFIC